MKLILSIIFLNLFLGPDLKVLSEGITVQKSLPRVATTTGTVEGFYRNSSDGRLFRAFQGIPYAEPPIGDLRFEVPTPVSPWTGVFMAKQYSPACLQYNMALSETGNPMEGDEDCLYLNIFTPMTEQSSCDEDETPSNLLPVIFFIPGGGFQSESASNYEPDYLFNRDDVILVTTNYRLGPLGFLSTEDEIVPGNMGLKDQVVALRWVNDNIEAFGGDPSRILLTGQSAGGASVHYHYLTNTTKDLFRGGLSLSGTALHSAAQAKNSLEKAKKLSAILGCPTTDNRIMIDCLKDRPGNQLMRAVSEFQYWLGFPVVVFGPVVEKGGGDFTFIDRSPIDIIIAGDAQDLPWVTSSVSEEGIYLVAGFINDETLVEQLISNWTEIAPYFLDYNYTIPQNDHARIAELTRKYYFGDKPIEKSTSKQLIDVAGKRALEYAAGNGAQFQACFSQSPVHFYYFSYRGAHSYSDVTTGTEENFGVDHKDDLAYVFQIGVDTASTPNDRAMQKTMIDFWVSLATNLTTNVGQVNWAPVDKCSESLNYLHIAGPNEIEMNRSDDFGDIQFWNSLGFRENIPTS